MRKALKNVFEFEQAVHIVFTNIVHMSTSPSYTLSNCTPSVDWSCRHIECLLMKNSKNDLPWMNIMLMRLISLSKRDLLAPCFWFDRVFVWLWPSRLVIAALFTTMHLSDHHDNASGTSAKWCHTILMTLTIQWYEKNFYKNRSTLSIPSHPQTEGCFDKIGLLIP